MTKKLILLEKEEIVICRCGNRIYTDGYLCDKCNSFSKNLILKRFLPTRLTPEERQIFDSRQEIFKTLDGYKKHLLEIVELWKVGKKVTELTREIFPPPQRKKALFSIRREETGWFFDTPVSELSDSFFWEREEYYIAAEGEIVRRWYDHFNKKHRCEVFRGSIEIRLDSVSPSEKEIKESLKREKFFLDEKVKIRQFKTRQFVEIVRCAATTYFKVIEEELKHNDAVVTRTSHPLRARFYFENPDAFKTILYNIDTWFPSEKEALREFFLDHTEEIMTLEIERGFKVNRYS